jgi:hypothetical protein
MSNVIKVKPKTKLYLAYGSNLNHKAMLSRCPDAKPIGTKMLSNARLVFRGVADLAFEPNGITPAGLWRITEDDEAALDRYEGAGYSYEKFHIRLGKKDKREALIYIMKDRTGIYPPSAFYVSKIRDGYRNFILDESFLDEAIKHSFESKDPSDQTRSRRKRQRNSTNQTKLVEIPESVALARMRQETIQ